MFQLILVESHPQDTLRYFSHRRRISTAGKTSLLFGKSPRTADERGRGTPGNEFDKPTNTIQSKKIRQSDERRLFPGGREEGGICSPDEGAQNDRGIHQMLIMGRRVLSPNTK